MFRAHCRRCSTVRLYSFALAAAVLGFAALALAAQAYTGRFDGLDPFILHWFRDHTGDSGTIVTLASDVTLLGNNSTLWIVTLGVAGYLIAGKRWSTLLHLIAATALGGLLTAAIKGLVDRPRPAVVAHLVEVHSRSFPSGHAMNSAFVYGTLAMIAARTVVDAGQRRYVTIAALLLTFLIGLSRVILGVHWPSDVLAGWTFGLGWTLIAAWLSEAMARRRA